MVLADLVDDFIPREVINSRVSHQRTKRDNLTLPILFFLSETRKLLSVPFYSIVAKYTQKMRVYLFYFKLNKFVYVSSLHLQYTTLFNVT